MKSLTQREALIKHLASKGIPAMVYYYKPMHKQIAFSDLPDYDKDLMVTNHLCDTVLSLPMHPYMTEEDIVFISKEIKHFLQNE